MADNYAYGGTGGSGAGYHAIIKITEAGNYTLVCGNGAQTYSGPKSDYTGPSGDTSTISFNGQTLISAGGGTGGWEKYIAATKGEGGTLTTNNLNEYCVFIKSNGNDGNAFAGGAAPLIKGAESIIPGHNYGASGDAQCTWDGGGTWPSINGCIIIKFLGTTKSSQHGTDLTDYEYTNTNKNLILTKYIGTDTDVTLPYLG